MKRFFYTFGSCHPFGRKEFVEVHATSEKEANRKYRDRFPGRDRNCLNCAFVYDEAHWEEIYPEYYRGREPALIL